MNSCNTDIFFSNYYHLLSVRFEFVKLRPVYSVKLIFSHVVKGIKIEITAKFRASRRLGFENTKRIMSPEIRPKRFGTFEKQAPGSLRLDSKGHFASFTEIEYASDYVHFCAQFVISHVGGPDFIC